MIITSSFPQINENTNNTVNKYPEFLYCTHGLASSVYCFLGFLPFGPRKTLKKYTFILRSYLPERDMNIFLLFNGE